MSLATVAESPTISPVYTLELTGRVLLKGWLVYSADAYSLATIDRKFYALQFNNTSLTLRASIALVEANDGSWFQDSAGVVYVNPPTGESIYTESVQGVLLYTFSKGPNKIFDAKTTLARSNCYFESRINSIPALSLRIEPRFSGVGQIGGGTCELLNGDGFFDELDDVDWWRASFYMGADTDRATMSYADYEPLGSYRVEDWKSDRSKFTLSLKEPKNVLSQRIPVETFTREDYPNIDQNNIGKIVPRIYGRVYGATPICVDAGAKRFKICGHAVYEISEVRIEENNAWIQIPIASKDESNGEFTLGADWDSNQPVCVDVIGRENADGSPMVNWSDVVLDLLEYIGETEFDTDSFDDAHDALTVGTYSTGQENTFLRASLNIDAATTVQELISKACNAAGAFVYVNASGEWHFEVYRPLRLTDVSASYDETDILLGTFSKREDIREVFSKVSVNFAHRFAEDWAQNVVYEREQNQHRAGVGSVVLKEIDAPLSEERDAQYYAQRLLTTDGEPLTKIMFAVKWRGLLRKPGEQVAVSFPNQNINGVFEILEARHDLNSNRVSLTCGDRRAWADSYGFWVADGTADWNSAGTETEKREASENSGFWHADDNLADSTDSDSHAASRWF
jgi:hypothetical protein